MLAEQLGHTGCSGRPLSGLNENVFGQYRHLD